MGETYTGVVDRFEGEQAVILLESEGEIIDEVVVSTGDLPEAGRHDDAVLRITREQGIIEAIEYDKEETKNREETVQERFKDLSQRPPSNNDTP